MFFYFFDDDGPEERVTEYSEATFEDIKHVDEDGNEFWYARELQKVLEYKEWRNFSKVIEKAKEACEKAGNVEISHFVDVNKMVRGGVADIPVKDIMLSRYACYLIVQNGDPSKEVIALGQTYFAVKTRQQELIENYAELTEDQKRIAIRNEMKRHNAALADAAHGAGVVEPIDYAIFQNYGYMGLYNGMKAQDIKKRKGLKKNQDILVAAVNDRLQKDTAFILAGHFCIFDKSFPRNANRRKTAPRSRSGKGCCKQNALYRWPQGSPNHKRAWRHNARGSSDAGKEHQAVGACRATPP